MCRNYRVARRAQQRAGSDLRVDRYREGVWRSFSGAKGPAFDLSLMNFHAAWLPLRREGKNRPCNIEVRDGPKREDTQERNRMHYSKVWFAAIISIGTCLLAQTPPPGTQIFDTRCAVCQGEDATGGDFAPGIVTRIPTRTDSELATVVPDGLPNRGMPPVDLSDQARGDLVAYLRSLRQPRRGELAAARVTIETTDSRKLSGLAVNQSFEDMQLRTADGRAHLLRRGGWRYREVTSQTDWSRYDG